MENEDYLNLVTNQIELDKLLHSDFQLKRINKKINKLKNDA